MVFASSLSSVDRLGFRTLKGGWAAQAFFWSSSSSSSSTIGTRYRASMRLKISGFECSVFFNYASLLLLFNFNNNANWDVKGHYNSCALKLLENKNVPIRILLFSESQRKRSQDIKCMLLSLRRVSECFLVIKGRNLLFFPIWLGRMIFFFIQVLWHLPLRIFIAESFCVLFLDFLGFVSNLNALHIFPSHF